MLRGWFKTKADGHIQEKNCSKDQQPPRSRCFSAAERMDGFRADEGLDRESMAKVAGWPGEEKERACL